MPSHHSINLTLMLSKINEFAQGTVLKVTYSMLRLTSCVILARAGLSFIRMEKLLASDYLVCFVLARYATMCALYISLSPYMQWLDDVVNGRIQPYTKMSTRMSRQRDGFRSSLNVLNEIYFYQVLALVRVSEVVGRMLLVSASLRVAHADCHVSYNMSRPSP